MIQKQKEQKRWKERRENQTMARSTSSAFEEKKKFNLTLSYCNTHGHTQIHTQANSRRYQHSRTPIQSMHTLKRTHTHLRMHTRTHTHTYTQSLAHQKTVKLKEPRFFFRYQISICLPLLFLLFQNDAKNNKFENSIKTSPLHLDADPPDF